jgi:D-alanyl-D-alanine carboxypeptidase
VPFVPAIKDSWAVAKARRIAALKKAKPLAREEKERRVNSCGSCSPKQSLRSLVALVFVVTLNLAPRPGAASTNSLFPNVVGRRLDSQIATIMRKNNLPSVVVSVVVPGRGRYAFVGGFANLKTRLPRALNQPFRIASITKPFAATAILILVDRGLLRTTDPMSKWYPTFPNAQRITVDDLLRMRSGIPAPDDSAVLAKVYDAPLAPAPTLEDELATYARQRMQFKPPDTIGVYTDFNYDVLAGIARRVTGKDIGVLITQTVIDPLKLRDTSYPTGTGIPGPLRGYGWNPKTKRFDDKTLFNPPLAGASGAVISTATDLNTFNRAVCHGTLLKSATHRAQLAGKLIAGTHAIYGEGIINGNGVCGHSGTINGFNSDMYYFSKQDATLVVSVNRLDRDNKSQTDPILALMIEAIRRLPAR